MSYGTLFTGVSHETWILVFAFFVGYVHRANVWRSPDTLWARGTRTFHYLRTSHSHAHIRLPSHSYAISTPRPYGISPVHMCMFICERACACLCVVGCMCVFVPTHVLKRERREEGSELEKRTVKMRVNEHWHESEDESEWALTWEWMSIDTHESEWALTHMYEWVLQHILSPGTHVNESWHTCERVMAHMWTSHGTHVNETWHTFLSESWCNLWTCHPIHMNMSWHRYLWVMAHMWMSHGTHMNKWFHKYDWVLAHIWMSHGTHLNQAWHTHERVMSHLYLYIYESVISFTNETHETHETRH